ncbi:hypothetical protein HXA34_20605 [Salipaludibacillus agaradhaerens]|uniref:hypothetical protein n=1 Tax=Salipaludibacillus agaradhaerens TaxID=76935 RepID=UPI0021513A0E|nr:hypothetical protein [Salipaludibacillus agaradhaerens]MCR6108701.1 hypothetical protein [Salipaludibacillus agaradhaerens]MCR6120724.1 hypothetical protein [Salipaludibacillus agaradhaerens]
MLKSRNTMVASAVLFLLVVVLLRIAGGFFEDNIVRVIGAIFGGSAENIPLLDFSTIDFSWMNPSNWSMEEFTSGVNQWLHDMIDSVLPAFINTLNIGAIMTTITRSQVLSMASTAAKAVPGGV